VSRRRRLVRLSWAAPPTVLRSAALVATPSFAHPTYPFRGASSACAGSTRVATPVTCTKLHLQKIAVIARLLPTRRGTESIFSAAGADDPPRLNAFGLPKCDGLISARATANRDRRSSQLISCNVAVVILLTIDLSRAGPMLTAFCPRAKAR
jgi:hypothetical protein